MAGLGDLVQSVTIETSLFRASLDHPLSGGSGGAGSLVGRAVLWLLRPKVTVQVAGASYGYAPNGDPPEWGPPVAEAALIFGLVAGVGWWLLRK